MNKFTKEVQNLHFANYKTWSKEIKEIKEDLNT